MDKIIIIGGIGTAAVCAEQIYDTQVKTNAVEFLGFAFDDERYGKEIDGFPVLCKTYDAYKKYERYSDVKFMYQLYRPDIMKERIDLLESFHIPMERMATFIHHSAFVARSAKVGSGTFVAANCVINSHAQVGRCCTLQSNVLIGHDTILGDYNFFAAHTVMGSSNKVGNANFFALNSSINNKIEIGDHNFIGMASNVIKSLENDKKVYGNPAKEFTKALKAF